MRCYFGILVSALIFSQCSGAVDTYTKKVISLLQAQLTQQNLVDMFKRGGSLDPAISTILQTLPNAEISAFTCFLTNINGAISAARANTGDIFAIVVYYRGVCKGDPNLNKAMEVLTDKSVHPRLRKIVTDIIDGFPAQIRPVALSLVDQAFSGKNITVAEANNYIKIIKNMNTATKNAIFKKLPSTKSVLNKKGPYNKPYNVLLTNLPILISTKLPTGTLKKNINAAIVKAYEYGHKNAAEYVNAAIKWVKALPINEKTANEPTTLTNYRTGALKLVQNGKMALAVPMTQETIQSYLNNPYQLP